MTAPVLEIVIYGDENWLHMEYDGTGVRVTISPEDGSDGPFVWMDRTSARKMARNLLEMTRVR